MVHAVRIGSISTATTERTEATEKPQMLGSVHSVCSLVNGKLQEDGVGPVQATRDDRCHQDFPAR
jgi:hypothetical protein